MAQIIKIGTWQHGMPNGWWFDCAETPPCGYVMNLEEDGRVLVGEVEIVEWTEMRRKSVENKNRD